MGLYRVDGTTITMTRGDTVILQVGIKQGDTPYTPAEGDVVRFALKSQLNGQGTAFRESTPLILKTIPNETMILQLDPQDTKNLPFGVYTYDIEITFANGIVDTFICDSTLILAPEVH